MSGGQVSETTVQQQFLFIKGDVCASPLFKKTLVVFAGSKK